jgi:ubiquinone/menaquinone biosynthesis C-methylase UbiE
MEPNLQRRVQRYGWDKASEYYEDSWQAQLRPAHDCLMELADPKQGENVMDVASGTGLVTFRLAEKVGTSGHVLGADISEEMVSKARHIAEHGGISNVSFQRMEVEEMAVDDQLFDLVVCALGLMYVPEVDTAFNEMYRVLKLGGRAAVAVWGQRKNCGWADIFPIVDSRVSSDVCPLFFQLGTGDLLKHAYQQAGFINIQVRQIATTLEYIDGESACEAAFLGGPVALAYARFNDRVKAEAKAEYIESIERYRTRSGYAIPGEFVVATGFKKQF